MRRSGLNDEDDVGRQGIDSKSDEEVRLISLGSKKNHWIPPKAAAGTQTHGRNHASQVEKANRIIDLEHKNKMLLTQISKLEKSNMMLLDQVRFLKIEKIDCEREISRFRRLRENVDLESTTNHRKSRTARTGTDKGGERVTRSNRHLDSRFISGEAGHHEYGLRVPPWEEREREKKSYTKRSDYNDREPVTDGVSYEPGIARGSYQYQQQLPRRGREPVRQKYRQVQDADNQVNPNSRFEDGVTVKPSDMERKHFQRPRPGFEHCDERFFCEREGTKSTGEQPRLPAGFEHREVELVTEGKGCDPATDDRQENLARSDSDSGQARKPIGPDAAKWKKQQKDAWGDEDISNAEIEKSPVIQEERSMASTHRIISSVVRDSDLWVPPNPLARNVVDWSTPSKEKTVSERSELSANRPIGKAPEVIRGRPQSKATNRQVKNQNFSNPVTPPSSDGESSLSDRADMGRLNQGSCNGIYSRSGRSREQGHIQVDNRPASVPASGRKETVHAKKGTCLTGIRVRGNDAISKQRTSSVPPSRGQDLSIPGRKIKGLQFGPHDPSQKVILDKIPPKPTKKKKKSKSRRGIRGWP